MPQDVYFYAEVRLLSDFYLEEGRSVSGVVTPDRPRVWGYRYVSPYQGAHASKGGAGNHYDMVADDVQLSIKLEVKNWNKGVARCDQL